MHAFGAALRNIVSDDRYQQYLKAEEEKESKSKKDDKTPELDAPGLPALTGPALPPVAPLAVGAFAPGSRVRDIFSGNEGVVAPPPAGNFGDVEFVTFDLDSKTHPIRRDQLEAVTQDLAPGLPAAPPAAPGTPALTPNAQPPAGAPLAPASLQPEKPKAKVVAAEKTSPAVGAMLAQVGGELTSPTTFFFSAGDEQHPVEFVVGDDALEIRFEALDGSPQSLRFENTKLGGVAAGNALIRELDPDAVQAKVKKPLPVNRGMKRESLYAFRVLDKGDDRKMSYGSLLASLRAAKADTYAAVVDAIGYVPKSFAAICARLEKDGLVFKPGQVDAKVLKASGLTKTEILLAACRALGPQGIRLTAEMFEVVTGDEPIKVVDLDTGGEAYFEDKASAYKHAFLIKHRLGHNYRIEFKEPDGKAEVTDQTVEAGERQQKNCPDCDAAIGEEHDANCDVARCSKCGGQRMSCECPGDKGPSVWEGHWPKSVQAGTKTAELDKWFLEHPGGLPKIFEEKGLKTDRHETDLYVEDTPEARAAIEDFERVGGITNKTFFIDDIDHKPWIELPFLAWESKYPGEVEASKPTVAKPTEVNPGMQWVWDSKQNAWVEMPASGSMAAEQKVSAKQPVDSVKPMKEVQDFRARPKFDKVEIPKASGQPKAKAATTKVEFDKSKAPAEMKKAPKTSTGAEVKASESTPWYGAVNQANPDLGKLRQSDLGEEAERLMVAYSDLLDALFPNQDAHRGLVETKRAEVVEAVKAFAPEKSVDPAIYLLLEDENYHLLNEILVETGRYADKSVTVPEADETGIMSPSSLKK